MSSTARVLELGLLVPRLEQAIDTFSIFGYELSAESAPLRGEDGRQLSAARMRLRGGPDLVLEQLDRADGGPLLARWGLDSHPCWQVEDIEAAVAALRAHGMASENGIFERFGPEAGEGSTYIHFPSPWGMDLELIADSGPLAYEDGGGPPLWHPRRGGAGMRVVQGAGGGMPGNLGTAHMGMRVPDLDEAIELFTSVLDCELVFRHSPQQRSGGRWTEIPQDREPPEPDRSVPDERFPHGTRIRVAFVRCANFNFELMELAIPDEGGALLSVFDRESALVMHPVLKVDSLEQTVRALEQAGGREDLLLPGVKRYLTSWGQAIGLRG